MRIHKAAKLYVISPTTIVSWKRGISVKPANRSPRKIADGASKQDIIDNPDAYYYKRAARLDYSKFGVERAMKRLSYTRKESLGHSKAS
ncbi:IS630 transposase-related protein [Psychrobacter pygoscelis]|uniref:IS630 transposase-related protein n=1 Tax=Psychrobacter pygoscelis TaxID=2488563 RepID=UPI00103C9A6E